MALTPERPASEGVAAGVDSIRIDARSMLWPTTHLMTEFSSLLSLPPNGGHVNAIGQLRPNPLDAA